MYSFNEKSDKNIFEIKILMSQNRDRKVKIRKSQTKQKFIGNYLLTIGSVFFLNKFYKSNYMNILYCYIFK